MAGTGEGQRHVRRVGEMTVALGNGREKQGDKPARSPVYRNLRAADGFPADKSTATLYSVFESVCERYSDEDALGARGIGVGGQAEGFHYLTYLQVRAKAEKLASAMKVVGVPRQGKVGIYAVNCPEYMLVIQAANRGALVTVPLYDSLGEAAVEYAINHAVCAVLFVSDAKLPTLLHALPNLKQKSVVVYWGNPSIDVVRKVRAMGLNIFSFDEFLDMGTKRGHGPDPPVATDIACIMYTSGTTGDPKGVVLKHRTVVAAVDALATYVEEAKLMVTHTDSVLSFLPLAHIFGRVVEEFMISRGSKIGYWQGDVKKLTDDVAALKPTIFVAVPRVLERVQSGIQAKVNKKGWLSRSIFSFFLNRKQAAIMRGTPIDKASRMGDWLLFNTVRKALGGRLRFVISGGAPLSTSVERFLSAALCAPVFQGYGLTETCAASFLALPIAGHSGTVGPPTIGIECVFEGVEEMGYDPLAPTPRGELLFRGPELFTEYYQDPERTQKDFDPEGWFHSGDVGELTPDGCLKVIDRVKNMFKLAQGEYIAAERLENTYSAAQIVEQIWVYGNSYESQLVAVVVPDQKALKAWASDHARDLPSDMRALCGSAKARQHVLAVLKDAAKSGRLKGFERISAVLLEPEAFSAENDLMTPSFKLKRNKLQKKYQPELDRMYADLKKQAS